MLLSIANRRRDWAAAALLLWLLPMFACWSGSDASFDNVPTLQASMGTSLAALDKCCNDGQHAPVLRFASLLKSQPRLISVLGSSIPLVALLVLMTVATFEIRAGPRNVRFHYLSSLWPQAPPL